MDLRGIEAAIFDLDGTIADSMEMWDRVDDIFFEAHGLDMPDDYKDAIKAMDFNKAAEYTKRRFNLSLSINEIICEWYQLCENEYANNIELKPHAAEFIKKLSGAGLKIGLATATDADLFIPLLKKFDIFNCFDAYVTTDQAGKDKNSPDVYLLCAEKLKTPPERCIVFEDILAGIKSAKSVGMKVAGVFDNRSACEKEQILKTADYYIHDFGEVADNLIF
ncbi:HAD family phosphatase [[Clostridium] cellulosi]